MDYLLAALLVVGLTGCSSSGEKNVKLETQQDKVSYSIGLTVGNNLVRDSITVTPDAFLRGVMDARRDSAERLMTDMQVHETMIAFKKQMDSVAMERAHAQAVKNKEAGDTFLATNAHAPGVKTLPSGLQYRVITDGKG